MTYGWRSASAGAKAPMTRATPSEVVARTLHDLDVHHPGYSEQDRAESIVSALEDAGYTLMVERAPDADCYTLPNGECVAPECSLHGPMVPAESHSDTAASCDPAGTPDRTFVAEGD